VPYSIRSLTSAESEKLVRGFEVAEGESIAPGDIVALTAEGVIKRGSGSSFGVTAVFGGAGQGRLAALSETAFVLIHEGKAFVGLISDNSIGFGSEFVFSEQAVGEYSVAPLSDSKFVVVSHEEGMSVIGDVAGDIIGYGEQAVFNGDGSVEELSIAVLSATQFAVLYRNTADSNMAMLSVADVSGNSVSFGPAVDFVDGPVTSTAIVPLTSAKFAVIHSGSAGMARVGTLSQNSVTSGTAEEFSASPTPDFSAFGLSDSQCMILYADGDNGGAGTAIVGTVSDSSIFFGPPTVFHQAGARTFMAAGLSDSLFLLAFQGNDERVRGTAVLGHIAGNEVSFGPEVSFNNGGPISVAALSGARFLIAHGDVSFDAPRARTGVVQMGEARGNLLDDLHPLGIADATGVGGQKVPVIVHGISGRHAGLTPTGVYTPIPTGR